MYYDKTVLGIFVFTMMLPVYSFDSVSRSLLNGQRRTTTTRVNGVGGSPTGTVSPEPEGVFGTKSSSISRVVCGVVSWGGVLKDFTGGGSVAGLRGTRRDWWSGRVNVVCPR